MLDARGRVISFTAAPGQAPVQLTYDGEGRLSRVEQGAEFWNYGFDSRDRITSRANAGGTDGPVRV